MSDPDIAAEEAPDPAVLSAEKSLRLLDEMSEIGMQLLRGLPNAAAEPGNAAESFVRLSRAIRLTLVLQGKIHAELRDLKAGVVKARADAKADADKRDRERVEKIREARIERVRELVANVVDSEHENEDHFDRVSEALDIRLEEDERIFGDPEHPIRAVVERLCKDLGVHPDWSLWDREGWIVDDPLTRRRFVSLRRPGGPETPPPTLQPNGHALE